MIAIALAIASSIAILLAIAKLIAITLANANPFAIVLATSKLVAIRLAIANMIAIAPLPAPAAAPLPAEAETSPSAEPAVMRELRLHSLVPPSRSEPLLPPAGVDLKDHIEHIESSLIKQALAQSGGVVAHAAKLLNTRRTTLVEKLRKYGLQREDVETSSAGEM